VSKGGGPGQRTLTLVPTASASEELVAKLMSNSVKETSSKPLQPKQPQPSATLGKFKS
jgi:hypothetical protein